jgi:hypothetical protein
MPRTVLSKLRENPDYLKEAALKSREKARKKKSRYRVISFKITDDQKEALEVMCKRQKTTPVRFLKSVIHKQTARYKASPAPVSYATENQLQLFDVEPQGKKSKTGK